MASFQLEDDYQLLEVAGWCADQPPEVAATSSDAGDEEVGVKRIKLDLDAAAAGCTSDVIDSDAADFTSVARHVDELRFSAAAVPHSPSAGTAEDEFVVTVRYCGREVLQRTVSGRTGCRLCYNHSHVTDVTERLDDFLPNELGQALFGLRQAEAIVLPLCENHMNVEVHRTVASKMLSQGLQRGLVIHCIDGNIFVYRLCQCAVFYYQQAAVYDVGLEPVKLRRIEASPDSIQCLFDHNTFVAALKDFLDDRGPKPDPYCVLVLGQKQPFCRDDSSVLVSVTVATSRALEDLRKAEEAMALRTPSVLVSSSNEFDNLARYMQTYVELSHQQPQQPQLPQQAQAAFNVIEVQYSPDNEPQDIGTEQSAVLPNREDVLE